MNMIKKKSNNFLQNNLIDDEDETERLTQILSLIDVRFIEEGKKQMASSAWRTNCSR